MVFMIKSIFSCRKSKAVSVMRNLNFNFVSVMVTVFRDQVRVCLIVVYFITLSVS